MHHARKIEDLKLKARGKVLDFYTMQMAAINRKQVPLCWTHHNKLHNNNLSDEEPKLFTENLKKHK